MTDRTPDEVLDEILHLNVAKFHLDKSYLPNLLTLHGVSMARELKELREKCSSWQSDAGRLVAAEADIKRLEFVNKELEEKKRQNGE